MKKILISLVFIMTLTNLNAQVFVGFNAFKKIIEYEGQRFLMDEVYEVSNDEFDKLRIDKTIQEIDSDEGFMFVLTSYTYNQKKGVVLTSFNATNFQKTEHQFTNIHLTHSQFKQMHEELLFLDTEEVGEYQSFIKTFNDRIIIECAKGIQEIEFIVWIDKYSRHSFTVSKWKRAFKRYEKFIDKY